MPSSHLRHHRIGLALVLGLAGCGQERPAVRNDTVATLPTPATEPPVAAPPVVRDTLAGIALLIPDERDLSRAIVLPIAVDSTIDLDSLQWSSREWAAAPSMLLSPATPPLAVHLVNIETDTTRGDCSLWPTTSITRPAATSPRPWSVGLVGARGGVVVALDSIDAMSARDSMNLAIAVARSASRLPPDTEPSFRGLQYRVATAVHFQSADSAEGIAARVVRTLNQEADPREEVTFLIGERAIGTRGPYEIVWFERATGPEGFASAAALQSVVRLGTPGILRAILQREFEDGGDFAMIQRDGFQRWRLVWRSAYAGC